MDTIKSVMNNLLIIILYILLFLIAAAFLYVLIKLVLIRIKYKKDFKKGIKETKFIKPVDFIKWVIIDLLRGKDNLKLFGIWAFTGYYGQGKTMGCTMFARKMQKDYPHRDIKIYSNINIEGQVRKIESWEEVLNLPRNSIMIYDESQSDWNCNNRDFPDDLLRQLTQQRKKQIAFFMTSPVYNRMNINIRESVNFVIECRNRFNLDRWFNYTFYRAEDYEQYRENKLKLRMNRYFNISLIASDEVYSWYDTEERVESIKKIVPRDKLKSIETQTKSFEEKLRALGTM